MTRTVLRCAGGSMPEPEQVGCGGGSVVAFTRALDPEAGNQDAVACVELDDSGAVLVLADGAGGLPGGELAAGLAVEAVLSALEEGMQAGEGALMQAVLVAFDRANEAIRALGVGAASTLAVVSIEGRTLRSYHAGDSGVLVTGQRGRLRLVTIAHSPTGYAVEAGYMSEAQALRHEERHLVSNVLGAEDMRIEVGPRVDLNRYDTVVVASDGLLDNLRSEEIAELARKGPLAAATEGLRSLAEQRMRNRGEGRVGKPDDLSLLLFRPRGG